MKVRRPSPATVIATIALIVALGGTSYAAFSLPPDSVGTNQLKNSAVTSDKVKNHSLRAADFRADQLPLGRIVTVNGPQMTLPPGGSGPAPNAHCPPGTTVVGTGFYAPGGAAGSFVEKHGNVVEGWFANDSPVTEHAHVQAICAQTPRAIRSR